MLISDPDDLAAMLPSELPESFTTADLASLLNRPRRTAQQMAYCLREADVIVAIGKQGNTVEYRLRGRRARGARDRGSGSTEVVRRKVSELCSVGARLFGHT